MEWKEFEQQETGVDSLRQNEVVVQTRAIGSSHRDYEVAMGQLDGVELGIDFAGTVLAAGPSSGFLPGDAIFSVLPSKITTVMKVDAQALARIPSHMGFAEAASLPSSLWVAYQALANIARLRTSEWVLITQGASCTGQMILRLANCFGANPIVIASSDEQGVLLKQECGVPATDIIFTHEGAVMSKIMQRTQGHGIDVVVDEMEDHALDFIPCLTPFGHLIDIGLNCRSNGPTNMARRGYVSNITRSSVSIVDALQSEPQMTYNIFHKAVETAFEDHRPFSSQLLVFKPGDVKDAFAHYQSSVALGKCIIELNPQDVVAVSTYPMRSSRTQAYIIT